MEPGYLVLVSQDVYLEVLELVVVGRRCVYLIHVCDLHGVLEVPCGGHHPEFCLVRVLRHVRLDIPYSSHDLCYLRISILPGPAVLLVPHVLLVSVLEEGELSVAIGSIKGLNIVKVQLGRVGVTLSSRYAGHGYAHGHILVPELNVHIDLVSGDSHSLGRGLGLVGVAGYDRRYVTSPHCIGGCSVSTYYHCRLGGAVLCKYPVLSHAGYGCRHCPRYHGSPGCQGHQLLYFCRLHVLTLFWYGYIKTPIYIPFGNRSGVLSFTQAGFRGLWR